MLAIWPMLSMSRNYKNGAGEEIVRWRSPTRVARGRLRRRSWQIATHRTPRVLISLTCSTFKSSLQENLKVERAKRFELSTSSMGS